MNDRDELKGMRHWPYQLTDYEAARVRDVLDNHTACSAWVILSRSYNGFVREAALRGLSDHVSAEALGVLFERLNDWVPQVREQAAQGLEKYLVPERADLLLRGLGGLLALTNKQRTDHGVTFARARALLRTGSIRRQVEEAFFGSTGKASRFLFGVLIEESVGRMALLESSVVHRDLTVRQLAVDACIGLPAIQALPLLERAMQSSGASVRVKALRVLLTRVEDPRAYLRAAMFDASAAMRCLVRWAASRWQLDCRQELLSRLVGPVPDSKREWLGLIGLAKELNESLADPMLARALMSSSASVRLQALQALGERGVTQQIEALGDSSDKVFSAAIALLRQQPWSRFEASLERLLNTHWYQLPEARRWLLLTLKPGWRQLEYLLLRHEQGRDESTYWLYQLARCCSTRSTLLDSSTPKMQRQDLQQRLQELEEAGALPRGSVSLLK
ncbi:HEAT repeat domain-containing protein [Pseudomonas sp. FEN]|uniref:HEAT repeat domain-containing protein n=1 Tax=Pseudomonas sp. FEN TaxID=2767468 RepID=UPI00174AC52D|nr:PBS lyase [Pseudomonas sp. FEN]CAD5201130.1 PBS lyase HEAT-like repeat domain protein [Pseudomonas sp. FEN]